MGILRVAGPLTTSLRGLWASGLLPPGNGGTPEGGGDPKTDLLTSGTAGLAPQRGSDPTATAKRKASVHKKGGGPKTPVYEGEGTQEPWRRGATGCSMLSLQLEVCYGRPWLGFWSGGCFPTVSFLFALWLLKSENTKSELLGSNPKAVRGVDGLSCVFLEACKSRSISCRRRSMCM